jgi:hypothetical protein
MSQCRYLESLVDVYAQQIKKKNRDSVVLSCCQNFENSYKISKGKGSLDN